MHKLRHILSLLNSKHWKYRLLCLLTMSVAIVYICRSRSQQILTNGGITKSSHNPPIETVKVKNGSMKLVTHPVVEKVITNTVKPPTLRYEPVFLMNPSKICSDKNLKMIVYVHSAPGNLHRRFVLRETWGSNTYLNEYKAKVIFVTGISGDTTFSDILMLENEKYGDIVLANFQDSYKNLTMKAKSALTWISKYCGNVTYILKTDDDTFVHFERLRRYISTLEAESTSVTELLACNYKNNYLLPFRNKNSKYHVSKEEYPFDKFPPFCQGMAYLMSCDVVHKLNEGIRNPAKNQPFVWLDDVYITGIVFNNLKLEHTHLGFAFRNYADMKTLQANKHLMFFQSNEINFLWKNIKLTS